MNLVKAISDVVNENLRKTDFTDYVMGTVTSTSPLKIQTSLYEPEIQGNMLMRTEGVVPKSLDLSGLIDSGHNHPYGGAQGVDSGTSTSSDKDYTDVGWVNVIQGPGTPITPKVTMTIDGKAYPMSSSGEVVLNEGLAEGDPVIMMRVDNGNRFLIISKVYD